MEKVFKQGISWQDFLDFPVWRFNPDMDIYSPLLDLDEKIGSMDELHFRSKFITPGGVEFFGSIAGNGDVVVAVYCNDKMYPLNKSITGLALDFAQDFLDENPEVPIANAQDVFPLKFKTDINTEPYIDWEGVFDITG